MNKSNLVKKPIPAKQLTAKKRELKTTSVGFFESPIFAKLFALFGVLVLFVATTFWSILGAKINLGNSDQIVNSFLMNSTQTFGGTLLPSAHTFLLKWPIFLLVNLFGPTSLAFIAFTVLVVLATVALLVWLLYKIEKRPLIFGVICLALASIMLLIPNQSYPGALLPVNMAMLTTRNLEYIIYIVSLVLIIKKSAKNLWFWVAAILLGVLIASDKLFLTLSVGGSILTLLFYLPFRRWNYVRLALMWLIASLTAGLLAIALLAIVNMLGVAHIDNPLGTGPYGFVSNFHSLAQGVVYGLLSLLTNFGANPSFNAASIKSIPGDWLYNMSNPGAVTYIVNLLLFGAAIFAGIRLGILSLLKIKKKVPSGDLVRNQLSIMLIFTTIASLGVFAATNHYFPVDARYIGISFFALVIASTAYLSLREWPAKRVIAVGAILLVSVTLGVFATLSNYRNDKAALAPTTDRNNLVASALSSRRVDVLVGDYWRVLPIKLASHNNLNVMPMSSCLQARDSLSSSAWQYNLYDHSFAYLLTLTPSVTGYPPCSLDTITQAYGAPNASILIAGTISQPAEMLLIYDHGKLAAQSNSSVSATSNGTVAPITLNQLPHTTCDTFTVMNIVAHQDDDLLFLNPDLQHAIKSGDCVRTIYLTAGDAGSDQFYWLKRELGAEGAYSEMLGLRGIWTQRTVKISDKAYITVVNPQGNGKVSLIFMHLPDGNLNGTGFKNTKFESLAKLSAGKIKDIQSVDGQSSYTADELVNALVTLMGAYKPDEIHTQADYISRHYPDHSDHILTGRFANLAAQKYEPQFPALVVKFYIGYPIRQMPENVSGADLQQKMNTFFTYGLSDPTVCRTLEQCSHTATYNAYLRRQYQNLQ